MLSHSDAPAPSPSDIAQAVLQVLHAWQVEPAQQVVLLGYDAGVPPRHLQRLRAGMVDSEPGEFLERAHYILAIKNAVDSLHPHNVTAGDYWVSTPSFFYNGDTPLQVMLSCGADGMRRVLAQLNGDNY